MPLDTGAVTGDLNLSWGELPDVAAAAPGLGGGATLGSALKAAREHRGLDLDQLALVTRIRRQYLQAVEDMRLDLLPSRPFAIGYVRAYAAALDLDPDQAVLRFRKDAPEKDEPLRAPLGVTRERDPRLVLVGVSCAIVIGGVLLWNIAQRAMMAEAPPPSTIADAAVLPPPPPLSATPVSIGAPTPPPQEATTPKPYVTPGLEQQLSSANNTAASAAGEMTDAQAAAAGIETAAPAGSPFMAKGEVFGAPPTEPAVILQARKASTLTIQGGDGTVYFARLLSPGQAYRAPLIKGLTVIAAQPDDFDLYVGGLLKGPLTAGKAQATALAE